jgi:uncharacterized protein involved in cysteine biosynthesis
MRLPWTDRKKTFKEMIKGLKQTFKDEFKKVFVVVILTFLALLLNLFPLFYPVGVLILSFLFAIQFIDYSWGRHDHRFSACLADALKNFFPYTVTGLLFLILITVPLVNTLIPAFATSYFTVLWLHRQKKIT